MSTTLFDYDVLQVSAAHDFHTGVPSHVDFYAIFRSDADRDAFLARFPKSYGLRASTLSSSDGPNSTPDRRWVTYPLVTGHARLLADKVNGGVNETGLARVRKVIERAERDGIEVVGRMAFTNSMSLDEVRALVAR